MTSLTDDDEKRPAVNALTASMLVDLVAIIATMTAAVADLDLVALTRLLELILFVISLYPWQKRCGSDLMEFVGGVSVSYQSSGEELVQYIDMMNGNGIL